MPMTNDTPWARLPIAEGEAPLIFFEHTPMASHRHGIVRVALETSVEGVDADDRLVVKRKVVAHLRTDLQGVRALRKALTDALELAEQQPAVSEAAAPAGRGLN